VGEKIDSYKLESFPAQRLLSRRRLKSYTNQVHEYFPIAIRQTPAIEFDGEKSVEQIMTDFGNSMQLAGNGQRVRLESCQ